ncbi:MAG: divergent PAP2 family protein [Lentisphaerae bacterium]|nr:divergent PAP2 family protein [Lentisphaerota bacterium]
MSALVLFKNVSFWSPFCAWVAAQFTKMLCGFYQTRRLDFHYLVSTGGMPSAHSALASGLMTSIGLNHGFDSGIFALALAFAMVTMFDASTVRRASGLQASLLNEMVNELFKEHRFSERKLAELLGHTRLEVFMGMVMGILTALLVNAIAMLYWPV